MNILEEARTRKTDYEAIRRRCVFKIAKFHFAHVSIIIPVRNRTEFNRICTDHFIEAIKRSNKKIALTIVEHSDTAEHLSINYPWVNYIYIPADGAEFNKCLAHNIGALYSNRCNYYMFHDIDILVPVDFFIKLYENLNGFDAVQSFTKRRLIYANQDLSAQIMRGEFTMSGVNPLSPYAKVAEPGAPGGSLVVSRELFLRVGGYDTDFFTGYSVEDQFFFDKLNFTGRLGFCDNPPIEMVHLWHSPSHRLTKEQDFAALQGYTSLSDEQKREFIKIISEHFVGFANEIQK